MGLKAKARGGRKRTRVTVPLACGIFAEVMACALGRERHHSGMAAQRPRRDRFEKEDENIRAIGHAKHLLTSPNVVFLTTSVDPWGRLSNTEDGVGSW